MDSVAKLTMDSQLGDVQASRWREGRVRGRYIGREAGRGLEILGHAIDYILDEYLERGGLFEMADAELEAVEILTALNREIYLACPESRTLAQRWAAFWERRRRWRRIEAHPGQLSPKS